MSYTVHQRPTVGRTVHFYPVDRNPNPASIGEPYAAIITSVHGLSCSLFVMPPFGDAGAVNVVPFSPTPEPGCWCWPPREP